MYTETFRSLDGTSTLTTPLVAPDRYRALEKLSDRDKLIARGAGLSYVAAAAGEDVTSVDLRQFNRILAFDPVDQTIEVEAGISVGDLSGFTLSRGLIFPVLPGHPSITLGGAIACDAHGKNHVEHGTIYNHILGLRLWHPELGLRNVKAGTPEFDGVVGGLGLCGIVVSAQLRLEPFDATHARFQVTKVGSLLEAAEVVREQSDVDFTYSWHDAGRAGSRRLPGYVIAGTFEPSHDGSGDIHFSGSDPKPIKRKGPSLLNGASLPILNTVYARKLRRLDGAVKPLDEALFPLAALGFYYGLYGRDGLLEHQVLVPDDAWPDYEKALVDLKVRFGLSFAVTSLKRFAGPRRLISFTGSGLALTIDMANTSQAREFLAQLDDVDCQFGAIANVAKDSRISETVFKAQFPQWQDFQKIRAVCDPGHRFHSALAERLGL